MHCFVIMPMFARYAMQRTPLITIHEEYSGLWRLSSVYGLSLSQYGAPHAIPGRSWTTTIVHESLLVRALRVHGCDGLVRRIQLREILQKTMTMLGARTYNTLMHSVPVRCVGLLAHISALT